MNLEVIGGMVVFLVLMIICIITSSFVLDRIKTQNDRYESVSSTYAKIAIALLLFGSSFWGICSLVRRAWGV